MDLNFTLIGQMVTFAIFVWFTMKFVWPPILKALNERREKIAVGLSAAEQGEKALEKARELAEQEIAAAKKQAGEIIDQARQREARIIAASKVEAQKEADYILRLAQEELEREYHRTKEKLMEQYSTMVVIGAEKVLRHEIDKARNDALVHEFVSEIAL